MTLFNERTHSLGEAKAEGSLTDARKQTDLEFSALTAAINTFYHANELTAAKDPEVSAVLSDIILFLNAHINKYEEIYARHTPSYQAGKGKEEQPPVPPVPGTPDAPDTPDTPPAAPPATFTIASQAVSAESFDMPGYGPTLTLLVAEAEREAFGALVPSLLDPEDPDELDLQNCVLRMIDQRPESPENPTDYTLRRITTANSLPAGFDAEGERIYFRTPFTAAYDAAAEILKDGVLVARLHGVKAPVYVTKP
jgi:hypothetical protein